MTDRPFVLSIAGFDPSGGAGILADIKTFEASRVYGLGVCTALTFQNDYQFEGLKWVSKEDIFRQLEILFRTYTIDFVKIGLVENLEILDGIVNELLRFNPAVKIIFDPILKASAGFDFHRELNLIVLKNLLQKMFLITPNLPELDKLVPHKSGTDQKALTLGKSIGVYLKGGHAENDFSNDLLYWQEQQQVFEGLRIANGEKHGSGCVLSSAITANLALGFNIYDSCLKAKQYVTHFLASTPDLLGYHIQD